MCGIVVVLLFRSLICYGLYSSYEYEANNRVATGTGTPGKMRQLFPVREKSGNFK